MILYPLGIYFEELYWIINRRSIVSEVQIGDIKVGKDHDIVLVGEVGINANGSVPVALKLMDQLHSAGWDFIKFQKRHITGDPIDGSPVYRTDYLLKERESPWGSSQLHQKRGLEFGQRDYHDIDRHSKAINLPWFASPWDVGSVYFLDQFDPQVYKVASPVLTDHKLLSEIRIREKPVIISTGLANLQLIDEVVEFMRAKVPVILLHCISLYPCPHNLCHLTAMYELRKRYSDEIPVGYSGHEDGILPTLMAAAMGACMIERHITLNRDMYGSDQQAAIEEDEMKTIAQTIRWEDECHLHSILGNEMLRDLPNTPMPEFEQPVFDKFMECMNGIKEKEYD
jgi:N-acetylneuraminate synthase